MADVLIGDTSTRRVPDDGKVFSGQELIFSLVDPMRSGIPGYDGLKAPMNCEPISIFTAGCSQFVSESDHVVL